jgi:hypothetical protein
MNIIIGNTPTVKKDPEKTPSVGRTVKPARERRKNRVDRRKNVRGGVIVTLSSVKERRKQPERRKG